ncbi:MAG TPA: lipid-A-disaccharide synthase [Candidatus Limnocylindria bacterium]|nr:lipid-A-disaccharide synthase [Candidatus Limnocylindria bacterium]
MAADRVRALEPGTPKRVLLVAGEASGDLHGADLVAALRARLPDVRVAGMGGQALRAAGLEPLVPDVGDTAMVGVFEGWGGLRKLWRAYRTLARVLRDERPDLCVLIDFPEFNLRLAKVARRVGTPVLYYIGPQVWAWRRGRVRTIARRVDQLALVLPFEPAWYAGRGVAAEFVGHPLLDRVERRADRDTALRAAGLDPARRTLVLLPGSRRAEIANMLPPFLDAAARLVARDPGLAVALVRAHTVGEEQLRPHLDTSPVPVHVIDHHAYDVIGAADVALVKSGTATLECALLGCPMVIAYRLSPVTAALGRLLVRGVDHIGLPNIVAGRSVVPELIQGEVSGARLADAAWPLLADPARRAEVRAGLREVRERLGGGGAAARAAVLAERLLLRHGEGGP